MNLLKGHHCWVLRAFTSAFAHRRACRRSHEYSGDPFDPRRLLTVALYDNCSSQIALSSAVREAAFGTKLTARPGTRRPVDASDQSSGQPPRTQKKVGVDAAPSNSHLEPRTRAAREIRLIADCGTVSAYQLHPSAAQITTCKTSSAAPARKFAAATASLRHHARAAPTRAVQRQRTPVDV